MEKLNFKDELHFDEFPPTSTEEWEAQIESDLKGKDYKEVLRWKSGEGISPLPFYRKDDLEKINANTSHVHPTADWNVIEPIEAKTPKKANEAALHALLNGASGLYFCPEENYITSRQHLEILLLDIQLELITIRFGGPLPSRDLQMWLKDICSERGLKPAELSIHFSMDLLAESVLSGALPDKDELRDFLKSFDAFSFCTVDTASYANAGSTIIQQLAFALAAGNEYLGMNPSLAHHLTFNFASGPNYFLEIAKFRAFKMIWARVLEEYELTDAHIQISAETALWNKATMDAHNNMLRSTTEAMAAAIGGCDFITVHRYDTHFEEPSTFSSRIARNVQLILQEEAHLDKVADPGAGSYYIEELTRKMAEKSWELFQDIEAKGGFFESLTSGFIQELVSKARQQKIEAYREKDKVLVGVNKYEPDEETSNTKSPSPKFNTLDAEKTVEISKIELLNLEAELKGEDA